MCEHCHSNLSDEHILTNLKFITPSTSTFEKFNTTSISHFALTATGINGQEARILALSILSEYLPWRAHKHNEYVPETGMESMYVIGELRELLDFLTNDQKFKKPVTHKLSKTKRHERVQFLMDYWERLRKKYPKPVFFQLSHDRGTSMSVPAGIIVGSVTGFVLGQMMDWVTR